MIYLFVWERLKVNSEKQFFNMKQEWMSMFVINKGFLKYVIFTIHRNIQSLYISASFQSSKRNIHGGIN